MLSERVIFSRIWAMPNRHTFLIPPIRELVKFYMANQNHLWIDPFCGMYSPAHVCNDLNPDILRTFKELDISHMDAVDFLKMQEDEAYDGILLDPPYSNRQRSEVYKKVGMLYDGQDGRLMKAVKHEAARIVKPNGIAISCCWNSSGVGKKNGFEIIEILLVSHGGWHNDTIVTVERKLA